LVKRNWVGHVKRFLNSVMITLIKSKSWTYNQMFKLRNTHRVKGNEC